MKIVWCAAATSALALGVATQAVAQDKPRESIAGKAAAAQAAKSTRAAKPVAQPAATMLQATPAPAMSKPAGAENSAVPGKDASKSHCHSSRSDA